MRGSGARCGDDVYRRTPEGQERWKGDLYGRVMENDEVEITLVQAKPGGPERDWPGWDVPGEYADEEAAGDIRLSQC
jgi:hypothetical protein